MTIMVPHKPKLSNNTGRENEGMATEVRSGMLENAYRYPLRQNQRLGEYLHRSNACYCKRILCLMSSFYTTSTSSSWRLTRCGNGISTDKQIDKTFAERNIRAYL